MSRTSSTVVVQSQCTISQQKMLFATRLTIAAIACSFLAIRGLRNNSLTESGAKAAIAVGLITFVHPWPFFSVCLLSFYFGASKVTKVGVDRKQNLEEDPSSGRNAKQVLANGGPGALLVILHYLMLVRHPENVCSTSCNYYLSCAYVALYAANAGDTFSSELGILSETPPFLITTFKTVPPGTNGGVSKLGFVTAMFGGFSVGASAGFSFPCNGLFVVFMMVFGAISGLVGSVIDSLLGATLQSTLYNTDRRIIGKSTNTTTEITERSKVKGWKLIGGLNILDNNMVNLISSVTTALLMGLVGSVLAPKLAAIVTSPT